MLEMNAFSHFFDSDSTPTLTKSTPTVFFNIILRLHSNYNTELLKFWTTNIVKSNSNFTLESILVSILKFDSRLTPLQL